MRSLSFIVFSVFVLNLGGNAFADNSPFEQQKARAELVREILLLSQIQKDVERQDLARIFRLRKVSDKVLQSLDRNGIGYTETLRAYEELVLTYRYSSSILMHVTSPRTRPMVEEIKNISEHIAQARGIDTPYTRLTEQTFRQIYELLQTVNELSIPQELKDALNATRAPIGKLLAIASLGDRPATFAAALPVFQQIRALYPQFNQIAMSNAAFETILNIQGLVEFYASFAQISADQGQTP